METNNSQTKDIAIERLNATIDKRESMIDFILSTKRNMTDRQYHRYWQTLENKSYKNLFAQYNSLINKVFSE